MPPSESSYPADWARIAEKDWERSGNTLGVTQLRGKPPSIHPLPATRYSPCPGGELA